MYISLLTKIKNAQAVKKENVKVPYSKMDEAVLNLLVKNNFIAEVEKKGRGHKKVLDVKLKYVDGAGSISGVKFVSKPSRRIYSGCAGIKPVRHGYGLAVISTSQGILSGREVKKAKIGGEYLFEIW